MYEELLKKAQELWPKRPDLNPRTMREDAMLGIVCKLIDDALCRRALVGGSAPERVELAIGAIEGYLQQGYDPNEDAHPVVMRVYSILKRGPVAG